METLQEQRGATEGAGLKKMRQKLPVKLHGRGFMGDRSASPHYATDGDVLIARKAVLDDWIIDYNEKDTLIGPHSVQRCWEMSTRSPSRVAYFIGCVATGKAKIPLAIMCDGVRFAAYDPYKLSFAIQATAADGFELNKHEPKNNPVVLMKDGNPVAIVAPMRVEDWKAIMDAYQLVFEPVSIQDALTEEVGK